MAVVTPVVSGTNTQQTYASTNYGYSGDLGTPVKIAGTSLTNGETYLLFYHCAYGLDQYRSGGELYLVYNRSVAIGWSKTGGFSDYAPEELRASALQGIYIYTASNDYDIEFAYKTISVGRTLYLGAMSIIAIPLSQWQVGSQIAYNQTQLGTDHRRRGPTALWRH